MQGKHRDKIAHVCGGMRIWKKAGINNDFGLEHLLPVLRCLSDAWLF